MHTSSQPPLSVAHSSKSAENTSAQKSSIQLHSASFLFHQQETSMNIPRQYDMSGCVQGKEYYKAFKICSGKVHYRIVEAVAIETRKMQKATVHH